MFGIPSMIRAITGTIVTIFSEADKSVTTLAKSNEVWHSSVDENYIDEVKRAVKNKAVELHKDIEKANSQLNDIRPGLAEEIDARLELRFSKQNKD